MDKRKVMVLASALWIASIGWQSARADEVMDWNAVASTALSGTAPSVELRVMATMHLAMHDAINSIEPRYRPGPTPWRTSWDRANNRGQPTFLRRNSSERVRASLALSAWYEPRWSQLKPWPAA